MRSRQSTGRRRLRSSGSSGVAIPGTGAPRVRRGGRRGPCNRYRRKPAARAAAAIAECEQGPKRLPECLSRQAEAGRFGTKTRTATVAPHLRGESAVFEQAFRNIDDILHKDAGCTSELDYTEQSSWLLFLKYLDALERDKAMEAV